MVFQKVKRIVFRVGQGAYFIRILKHIFLKILAMTPESFEETIFYQFAGFCQITKSITQNLH